jgi:hypothetical protein
MSYLGIVATSLFASNALLTYGLGALPGLFQGAMICARSHPLWRSPP